MWFPEAVFPWDSRLLSLLFIACCFSQVNGDSQPTVVLFPRIYPLGSGSSQAVKGRARQRAVPFQEKWKSQTSSTLTALILCAVTLWRPVARYESELL